MGENTGQSEDPNAVAGAVEETGSLTDESGANAETGSGSGEDKGGQGQSKSQARKARRERRLRESEARSAQLEEDNRKLNERLGTLESQLDSVVNPLPDRPNRVDYDSDNEYEDALFEWRDEKVKREQGGNGGNTQQAGETGQVGTTEQASTTQHAPVITDEQQEAWMDQCDAAAEKYEDFDEALNNDSIPITVVMADTIKLSENGAEIAYYLAKNPAEAAKISKLPYVRQVTEIGKLAKNFGKTTTQSPDPITPEGGTDNQGGIDVSKMTPEQYRDHRRKQGMGR